MGLNFLTAACDAILKSGFFSLSRLRGAPENEVEALERSLGRPLPSAYREFLRLMGYSADGLFEGDLFKTAEVGSPYFREVAKRISPWAGAHSPDDLFVFLEHEDYVFYYFILDGGDDPKSYMYVEGESAPRPLGTFSEFLLSFVLQRELEKAKLKGV